MSEQAEGVTVVEYGLRAPDGTVYDGADEGLRWTREQAEQAQEDGDVLIRRTVTTFEPIITDWTDPKREGADDVA